MMIIKWLRTNIHSHDDCTDNVLYMIGIYVITGGAIKLTHTMQEREHTLRELGKMEKVCAHLLTNNIVDKDSFDEYMSELV